MNHYVQYAVFRDSLVSLFMLGGQQRASVLTTRCNGLRDDDVLYIDVNGHDPIYGSPRTATEEDFNHYRVFYNPKHHSPKILVTNMNH